MREPPERTETPASLKMFLRHSVQPWWKSHLEFCSKRIDIRSELDLRSKQTQLKPHQNKNHATNPRDKNWSRSYSPSIAYFISMAKRFHMISALILPIFNSCGNLKWNKNRHCYNHTAICSAIHSSISVLILWSESSEISRPQINK